VKPTSSSGPQLLAFTALLMVGALLALPTLLQGATVAAQRGEQHELADLYLGRMIKVWAEDASAADVEALGELLAENVAYEHPRVGIRVEGRRALLDAMGRFLGASRGPRVAGVEVLVGTQVVVLAFDLTIDIRDGEEWTPIDRRQVVVLATEGGLITGISDHW